MPSSDLEPPPAQAIDDAATLVLRQFRVVFNAVKTHFQQVEKRAGIGGAQVWALSVIQAQPGIGVNALARAMDIHQTTASNLVRSMSELGLVSARRRASDRRAVCLQLLRAGEKALARAPGPFRGVLPSALARLDPQTLRRLHSDLAALITMLGADDRAAGIPLAQL